LSLHVDKIHQLAGQDRVAFKKHAVIRMHQRGITADEVKAVLQDCALVEDYPDDYPLPSMLVLGYTSDNRPVHGVVALHEPTLTVWKEGFKERRAKDEVPIM
jgi:hypothetical protein